MMVMMRMMMLTTTMMIALRAGWCNRDGAGWMRTMCCKPDDASWLMQAGGHKSGDASPVMQTG